MIPAFLRRLLRMSPWESGHPIEWICGLTPDPTRDSKGLARPFGVLWMRDGSVFDVDVIAPTLTAARIGASYRETTRFPSACEPHVPDRIRVASPEVAEMLRAVVGRGVEVVSAPTPELDALRAKAETRERRLVKPDGRGETYLGRDVTVGGVSRFFTLTARLYKAAPWEHVPFDQDLIGVTCKRLGLDRAVLAVTGQDGTEEKGFMLFPSHAIFREFMETDFDAQGTVHVPPHLALTYERGADLAVQRRKEIAAHGFEVADARAYPSLWVLDGPFPRAPVYDDLERVGAIATALAGLARKPNLDHAWNGKGTIQTYRLLTTRGKLEMTLSAPHDAAERVRQGLVKVVRHWKRKR